MKESSMKAPVKKGPTTMKIADLFDAARRDQAVVELPDEDLIVAATIVTAKSPTDSLTTEWAAMDIAWCALHCERPSSAVSIIRHGTSVLAPREIFEQFVYVTHYRSTPVSHSSALRSRQSETPAKVAHAMTQVHGQEVFEELVRVTANMILSSDQRAGYSWFAELVPHVTDVELLRSLLGCEHFYQLRDVIQRLWDLGETKFIFDVADSKDPVFRTMTSARREANLFLMTANPSSQLKTKAQ